MDKSIFYGCGVATITPMNSDYTVNYRGYSELIDNLISNGADAIIVNGTTGECATLSDEEQYNIICCAKEAVNRRVPLIAGAGSNNTGHAAKLALNARNAGADAVLCVTPYYNKANEHGIVEHYRFIGEKASLPVIVYNVPSRTGISIKPQTYKALSELENICAVKEASGNMGQTALTMELCSDKLDFYSGNDDCIVPLMSIGAKGVISVLGNLVPRAVHEICEYCFLGNYGAAARLQKRYMPLISAAFSDVNPIPIKEMLTLSGFNAGPCRLPLCETDAETKNKIEKIMTEYELI